MVMSSPAFMHSILQGMKEQYVPLQGLGNMYFCPAEKLKAKTYGSDPPYSLETLVSPAYSKSGVAISMRDTNSCPGPSCDLCVSSLNALTHILA